MQRLNEIKVFFQRDKRTRCIFNSSSVLLWLFFRGPEHYCCRWSSEYSWEKKIKSMVGLQLYISHTPHLTHLWTPLFSILLKHALKSTLKTVFRNIDFLIMKLNIIWKVFLQSIHPTRANKEEDINMVHFSLVLFVSELCHENNSCAIKFKIWLMLAHSEANPKASMWLLMWCKWVTPNTHCKLEWFWSSSAISSDPSAPHLIMSASGQTKKQTPDQQCCIPGEEVLWRGSLKSECWCYWGK